MLIHQLDEKTKWFRFILQGVLENSIFVKILLEPDGGYVHEYMFLIFLSNLIKLDLVQP